MHAASTPHKTLELRGVEHAIVLKILKILRDCGALHENDTQFNSTQLTRVVSQVYGDLLKKHHIREIEIGLVVNQTIQDCYKANLLEMERGQVRTRASFDGRAEDAIKKLLTTEDIILVCERARDAVQVFRSS